MLFSGCLYERYFYLRRDSNRSTLVRIREDQRSTFVLLQSKRDTEALYRRRQLTADTVKPLCLFILMNASLLLCVNECIDCRLRNLLDLLRIL